MLATMNNTVNVLGSPPHSWSLSVVKLLLKKGLTINQGNIHIISHTSLIAKTYHLLLAKRLTKFLTVNNYINEQVLKAVMPVINGTIEHTVVLEEFISKVKITRKLSMHYFSIEKMHLVLCHTLSSHIPTKGLIFLKKFSFISTPCIIFNFLLHLWTTFLLMGFPLKEYFKVTCSAPSHS